MIGSWIQRTALSWYIYRITNSVVLLGVINFVSQFPAFFITPFSGVLADRLDRKKILIFTQFGFLIQSLTLAFLVYNNYANVSWLIALGLFQGIVDSFDAPTRQSFVINLVEKKEDLVNAIALNSAMFNGARLIGPTVAGYLIAIFSESICFFINGLSYIAVIASLFLIKIKPAIPTGNKALSVWENLKSGLKYAFKDNPKVRYLIINVCFYHLLGMSYVVLMPVIARDVLHGTAKTLGFLMTGVGTGALMGALYLASRKSVLGLGKKIVIAGQVAGSFMILFSLSTNLFLSVFLVIFIGIGMMFQMAGTNTLLQTMISDEVRGRVMSLYTMSFMTMFPLGALIVSSMSNLIGVSTAIRICGFCCLTVSSIGFIYLFKKNQIQRSCS